MNCCVPSWGSLKTIRVLRERFVAHWLFSETSGGDMEKISKALGSLGAWGVAGALGWHSLDFSPGWGILAAVVLCIFAGLTTLALLNPHKT